MSQASSFTANNFNSLEFPTFHRIGVSIHDHFIPHERNNYHPHILGHRLVALVSILAVTIKIFSMSVLALSPAVAIQASAITNETIVSLANEARVQNNMGELAVSNLLSKAAQAKANDMLARQYFSHNTPDGATPWSFIKSAGYSYTTAGENLAIDFTEAENVQSAWMNSPGHRANILNNKFQEIGIGIAQGIFNGHQTTIVVQMFGSPIAQQLALQPKPTPVAPVAAAPAPAQPSTPATQAPATSSPLVTASAPAAELAPIVNASEIKIIDTKTSRQGEDLYIEVETSANVSKLLAFYGERSIMLNAAGDNLWQGKIPLANIDHFDNVIIQAEDLNGKLHQEPLVQFTDGFNLNPTGSVEGESVTIFGKTINANIWEEKILLFILAALIASLILAIAIKRHVQHLSLVANTSFAAILIAMMLIV